MTTAPFRILILEGAQAAELGDGPAEARAYREASMFQMPQNRRYDARKVRALLADPGHHSEPPEDSSTISNAQGVSQSAAGSGASTLTSGISPAGNNYYPGGAVSSDVPARTAESDAVSKDLKKRGFRVLFGLKPFATRSCKPWNGGTSSPHLFFVGLEI